MKQKLTLLCAALSLGAGLSYAATTDITLDPPGSYTLDVVDTLTAP
jgi:hypothetical protein